jgi:GTPase SAR1 family protein
MLVGQGRAGKTALANNMMGKGYQGKTESTIGAEKFERKIVSGKISKAQVMLKEYSSPLKEVESLISSLYVNQKLQPENYTNVEHQIREIAENVPASIQGDLVEEFANSNSNEVNTSTSPNPLAVSNNDVMMSRMNRESVTASIGKVQGNFAEGFSPASIKEVKTSTSSKLLAASDIDVGTYLKCCSENIALHDTNSELIVSLYDFGGQDIFNVLHPFFMSRYGVYVVVFDMELLVSKDEEERESCMKHLKFWMNSIVMHTYDEKSRKTAPVAIVGTRKDKISRLKDHERISTILAKTFISSPLWSSLLLYNPGDSPQPLHFFPVNNTKWFSLSSGVVGNSKVHLMSTALTQLLSNSTQLLEKASFVTQKVSFVWIKIWDKIKSKPTSFLTFKEVQEICAHFTLSLDEIVEMLTFFYEMGILIWINEEKLLDIVILDPIDYFVKPATMIICKHIATKDDPYHTVHCEDIHKGCRKEWPEDWFQMLEFGLVSERLARKLLKSSCDSEEHVDKVLLLLQKFGLLTTFPVNQSNESMFNVFFIPAVAPSDPAKYDVNETLYSPFDVFNEYDKLVNNLVARRKACKNSFIGNHVKFRFAFASTIKALQLNFLSTRDVTTNGFLPNGLFERLIGRLCGAVFGPVSNVQDFLVDNNFLAFKDIVKLKYCSRTMRITNFLENNMIQIEYETGSEDRKEKENLMFVHDFLYELIQGIIREYKMKLIVVTLLPVDPNLCPGVSSSLFIPLSKVIALSKGTLLTVDYNTSDGQLVPVQVVHLRNSFHIWLDISTILPKENEYENKVKFVFFFMVLLLVCWLCRKLKNSFLLFFLMIGD